MRCFSDHTRDDIDALIDAMQYQMAPPKILPLRRSWICTDLYESIKQLVCDIPMITHVSDPR